MTLFAQTDTPVFVGMVGTSTIGTNNTLVVVTNSTTLASTFGTGTIVTEGQKLLARGIFLVVCKVASTSDADVVGADANSGLQLLQQSESLTGRALSMIIVPGLASSAIVTQMNLSAIAANALALADYNDTYANLVAARATSVNYGLKSRHLAICFPRLTVGVTQVPYSTYLAGFMGTNIKNSAWGSAPQGQIFSDVTGIVQSMTLPGNADTLVGLGVMTIGSILGRFSVKGSYSSLYPSDTTQNALFVRTIAESVIMADVRAAASVRINRPTNLNQAVLLESALTQYLAKYLSLKTVRKIFSRLDQTNSVFTSTSASLIYDIFVALNDATATTFSFTFQLTV